MSSVSNGLYFLTLPLVSVMRVIYTSKGMLKKFWVCVIYRKIRYIERNLCVELDNYQEFCFAIMPGPDSLEQEMLLKWWDALQAHLWSCQPCYTSCIINTLQLEESASLIRAILPPSLIYAMGNIWEGGQCCSCNHWNPISRLRIESLQTEQVCFYRNY